MTRTQLSKIINDAHDALHAGDTDKAHEILHNGFQVEPYQSSTGDPEAHAAAQELLKAAEEIIPCGHTVGDLIIGKGGITKCGGCILERTGMKPQDSMPSASSDYTYHPKFDGLSNKSLMMLTGDYAKALDAAGRDIPQAVGYAQLNCILKCQVSAMEDAVAALPDGPENIIRIKQKGSSSVTSTETSP